MATKNRASSLFGNPSDYPTAETQFLHSQASPYPATTKFTSLPGTTITFLIFLPSR